MEWMSDNLFPSDSCTVIHFLKHNNIKYNKKIPKLAFEVRQDRPTEGKEAKSHDPFVDTLRNPIKIHN